MCWVWGSSMCAQPNQNSSRLLKLTFWNPLYVVCIYRKNRWYRRSIHSVLCGVCRWDIIIPKSGGMQYARLMPPYVQVCISGWYLFDMSQNGVVTHTSSWIASICWCPYMFSFHLLPQNPTSSQRWTISYYGYSQLISFSKSLIVDTFCSDSFISFFGWSSTY